MTTQIPEIQDTLEILKSQISKQADVTVLEGETNQEIENIIQDLCDITSFARKLRHEGRICSFCGSKKVYAKGLCNTCYARYLKRGTPEYYRVLNPNKVNKADQRSWKEKLFDDVFEKAAERPAFTEDNIDGAIQLLDEKLKMIILLRYKEKLTCREIGEKLHVTGSYIQQQHQAALRKLRHDKCKRTLFVGRQQVKEEDEEKRKLATQARVTGDECLQKVGSFSIEEIGLSTRAVNCLRRAETYTIQDVVSFESQHGLLRIRNIGKAVYDEIASKLLEYGVNLQCYEHPGTAHFREHGTLRLFFKKSEE